MSFPFREHSLFGDDLISVQWGRSTWLSLMHHSLDYRFIVRIKGKIQKYFIYILKWWSEYIAMHALHWTWIRSRPRILRKKRHCSALITVMWPRLKWFSKGKLVHFCLNLNSILSPLYAKKFYFFFILFILLTRNLHDTTGTPKVAYKIVFCYKTSPTQPATCNWKFPP